MLSHAQLDHKVSIFLLEDCHSKRNGIGYRGGDILEGFVEFFASDPSSYNVKVSFDGTIGTWLDLDVNAQPDACVQTGEFRFLRQVQHVKVKQQNLHSVEHREPCRIRFRFNIPEQLISARSIISSEHLKLPPSTKSSHAFKRVVFGRTYMQARIVYMITAVLVKRDGNIRREMGHDKLEVEVMPSTKASPPLQLAHYPSEFKTTSQCSLKRHLWTRSMGTLCVTSWEPEAINLAVTYPRATVLSLVKLTLTPHQKYAAILRPYEWVIIAKTWLKARTFCSTRVSGEVPIIPSLKTNPSLQMHTETTESESRHCDSLGWRLDRLSPRGTIESKQGPTPWITFLRVPISASKDLLPTFLTPLAAHRYSLCLLLSIAGFSHRPLYLEVPVQVIYDDTLSRKRDNDDVQDSDHSSERPPRYSKFH